jgi:hypothetical protein
MATVTVLARTDSQKYPVHFAILAASAETRPADKVLFDFHCRENVMVPTPDGRIAKMATPSRVISIYKTCRAAEQTNLAGSVDYSAFGVGLPMRTAQFI